MTKNENSPIHRKGLLSLNQKQVFSAGCVFVGASLAQWLTPWPFDSLLLPVAATVWFVQSRRQVATLDYAYEMVDNGPVRATFGAAWHAIRSKLPAFGASSNGDIYDDDSVVEEPQGGDWWHFQEQTKDQVDQIDNDKPSGIKEE